MQELKNYINNCILSFDKENIFKYELEWRYTKTTFNQFKNIDHYLTLLTKSYNSNDFDSLFDNNDIIPVNLIDNEKLSLDINCINQNNSKLSLELIFKDDSKLIRYIINDSNNIKKFYSSDLDNIDYNYLEKTKQVVSPIKNDDFGLKFEVSEESNEINYSELDDENKIQNIKWNNVTYRLKNRKIITSEYFKYDLTVTKTYESNKFNIKNPDKTIFEQNEEYEVEVELTDKFKRDYLINDDSDNEINIDIISKALTNILIPKYNNIYITSKYETDSSLSNFNKILSILLNSNNFKNDLPVVKNMTPLIYLNEIRSKGNQYYILDKTDGLHSFLFNDNGKIYLLDSKLRTSNYIGNVEVVNNIFEPVKVSQFILEGEYIAKENKFYIFDILYFDNSLVNKSFAERMNVWNNYSVHFIKWNDFAKSYSSNDFGLLYKKYYTFDSNDNFKKFIRDRFKEKNESEGLIFIKKDKSEYKTQSIYKWKQEQYLTIDLLVKKSSLLKSTDQNLAVFDLYYKTTGQKTVEPFIYNGNIQKSIIDLSKKEGFFNIEKTLYNNSVYEFKYDLINNNWIPYKYREDKTLNKNPNAKLTVENVFCTILNPITSDHLGELMPFEIKESVQNYINKINDDDKTYFTRSGNKHSKNVEGIIKDMAKFHNIVIKEYLYKYTLQRNVSANDKIYEIGYGQGADINRWKLAKFNIIHGIDPSSDGLKKLKARLHSDKNEYKPDLSNLKYGRFDLNTKTDDGYSVVSSQFSIHYIIDNNNIDDIFKKIHGMLKTNGYFIGTTLDSNLINEDLSESFESELLWQITLNDFKGKSNNKLATKNSVVIPSLNITKESIENRVYKDKFLDSARKNGFDVINSNHFDQFNAYNDGDIRFENLNPAIQNYSKLNFYFILQKN